ncbi:MAG: HopJ type III effector protein [Rickettsiales bacterium]|jgi:hypothetical protein|nr:HopJ type III effector protein [Rickettsiales bacterium]
MKKFSEIQDLITKEYEYTANGFSIGDIYNDVNSNQWSGRVLSYAKLNGLNLQQTLELFGEHYQDVLNNPNTDTHKNIRALIKYGVNGVKFDGEKLLLVRK